MTEIYGQTFISSVTVFPGILQTYKATQAQPIVQAQFGALQNTSEKSQANDDNAHSWYGGADRPHLSCIVVLECEYALTSWVRANHT